MNRVSRKFDRKDSWFSRILDGIEPAVGRMAEGDTTAAGGGQGEGNQWLFPKLGQRKGVRRTTEAEMPRSSISPTEQRDAARRIREESAIRNAEDKS